MGFGLIRSLLITIFQLVPMPYGLLLFLAATVVAALIARKAWRWRREPIPPTCRRCGYDVSHRPAGVETCSECGADLTAAQAITEIRRRANWWVMAPAGAVLLVTLSLFVIGIFAFPWTNWFYQTAPLSWIEHLATTHPGASGDAYREVWLRRAGSSPGLIDHLLVLQSDPKVPWTGRWGDVLIAAFRNGKMDNAQKKRFIHNLIGGPVTFRVHSPVRQGDPLLIRASTAPPAHGGLTNSLEAKAIFAAKADGAAVLDEQRNWTMGRWEAGYHYAIAPRNWQNNTAPGQHRISLALGRELVSGSDPNHPITKRFDQRGEAEVEVLPRGTPLGTPIYAPEMGDAIAKATIIHVYHWFDKRAFATVELRSCGVDRAFAIYAVIDGQEKPMGFVTAHAGSRANSNAIYVPLSVKRAEKMKELTIVLVGDGEALRDSWKQTKYWAGRIVYEHVAFSSWPDYRHDMQLPVTGPGARKTTTWPYRVMAERGAK